MRQSRALMRLYVIGEKPVYKKNGNLIFRQRFPYTPIYVSILSPLSIRLILSYAIHWGNTRSNEERRLAHEISKRIR